MKSENKVNLSYYINLFNQGFYFKNKLFVKLPCLERLGRWFFSLLHLCDTSAQVCAKRSFDNLHIDLSGSDSAAALNNEFIRVLQSEFNQCKPKNELSLLLQHEATKKSFIELCNTIHQFSLGNLSPLTLAERNEQIKSLIIQGDETLNLQVDPKKPDRSYPVAQEKKETFVKAFTDSKVQSVMKKAMDNIQHLTMKNLEEKLTECVGNLNIRLQELGIPSYAVGVTREKSSKWVADLALSDLLYLPSTGFSLGAGGVVSGLGGGSQRMADLKQVKEDVLVIFEDASYSGAQLNEYLTRIAHKSEKPLKIFVVVPFVTQRAFDILQKNFKGNSSKNGKQSIDLEIITSKTRIADINTIFPDQKEAETFCKIYFPISRFGTLCYTDWRFPDSASFIPDFGRVRRVDYLEEQRNIFPPYKTK